VALWRRAECEICGVEVVVMIRREEALGKSVSPTDGVVYVLVC
jgi:hypothetical protein